MQKNGFIRQPWLISDFMILQTSDFMILQTGQQITTIHILPNFSRSKDKQAMTFCQLMKHSVRNTFLQKSCKKRETSFRPPFVF